MGALPPRAAGGSGAAQAPGDAGGRLRGARAAASRPGEDPAARRAGRVQVISLPRRIVAEGVGTALLLAAIVGSGVMAERLADGNGAIALLANTIATAAALIALILAFGPISGGHFNPVVTVADASQGGCAWRDVPW